MTNMTVDVKIQSDIVLDKHFGSFINQANLIKEINKIFT